MPYKSKEDAKNQKRRWRAANKDKEQIYRARHAIQKRIRAQERRDEIRELRRKVFGDVCVLCGEQDFIGAPKLGVILHEIHGKPHYDGNHRSKEATLKDALKHKEDFAPVCIVDHRMVHRMMKVFGCSWEDILSLHKKGKSPPS